MRTLTGGDGNQSSGWFWSVGDVDPERVEGCFWDAGNIL